MRFLTFVFLLFPVSAIFAQQQHITYSSGQMTPEGRSRNYFEEAYKELEAMLEGRDSLDYERAVFLTENAYWDNQIAYSDFQNLLDLHTERIRKAASAIKETNQHRYESLKMFEKKNFHPLIANAAIYQYLTSPRIFIRDNRVMAEALFRYSHDDPYGTEDWTNSQVLSLLNPYRREGNCYAWTALFKIFSERLKSEAYISTAPHHVYIQHKDIKGGFYNVELPTRTFPGDGTIETLTYTTREGIMSGIAMRKLNLKESIGLCLIYLAKGYEYKFGESDAYFSLRCGNLALKHDSLNLNAMLLKAGVMEESLVRYMKKKHILEPEQLREIPEIKDVFIQYEQWIRRLNTLGYREIPSDVQDILLAKAKGEPVSTYKDRTPEAFPGLDVKDVRYITLSNGLFDEVHVRQKYMSYGRTVLDTETGRISAIVTEDSLRRYKVDPVVFALSVDPLASKYPMWSPYSAFANNPIYFVDEDGREPIKKQVGTVSTFLNVFNNTPSRMGTLKGTDAENALLRLGKTEWDWGQMRPLPTTTPYFNNKAGRYIYTEKGGWLDMVHFLFYAGKAYEYKKDGSENPIGEAVQDGYFQEMTDKYAAKHSAYSYEDLPSDKYGADFAVNHFDSNSDLTLGEQLESYLNNVLKATDPENAPNYKDLPEGELAKPTRTNVTTTPVYIKNNE